MFEIKWTPEAEKLYFETLEYWINHNKSNTYSLKIIKEVERKEKLLANNPFIGAIIIGAKDEVRRVLILENFSLHYRINKTTIEIVSFWANKKDLKI
ncbi:type II toxin-antitoxin system RelE/ParE family toxin [Epilithonimonas hungarica]|uniref:Plasmid stabilization system protein ParE n=1 Tax=Epilithonimonas hungarica TaxID=454006 RepID=A0A1G7P6B2_9FLAO|nr:type II toxin-antitoxin system RelE/ParE family toxin [Epilithonimonas hungarica]SDF80990.1 Plasmid stabilization system protein ParE [Epilithonimonas hungarica]